MNAPFIVEAQRADASWQTVTQCADRETADGMADLIRICDHTARVVNARQERAAAFARGYEAGLRSDYVTLAASVTIAGRFHREYRRGFGNGQRDRGTVLGTQHC